MDYLYPSSDDTEMSGTEEPMLEMDNTYTVAKTLHIVQNVLFPLISAFGILANLMVIIVIVIWERYRANRTVANVFIVNLALADLLFLIILPLHMPILQINGWRYGNFMCKFIEMSTYVNFRASILLLTIMSVDRFLAITYSLQSRSYRSRKNAIKISAVMWVVSTAAAVPIFIYANVDSSLFPMCTLQFPGYKPEHDDSIYQQLEDHLANYTSYGSGESQLAQFEYDDFSFAMSDSTSPNAPVCVREELKDSDSFRAWTLANFVIFFIIPVLVVVFCYVSIARETLTRKISSSNAPGTHYQVAITIAVLVSVFIVCWFPLQIWKLMVLPPGKEVSRKEDCNIIDSALSMLAWSNSALNPILYSISSKRFRRKAVQAWNCMRYGYHRSLLMEQQSIRTMNTKVTSSRTQQSRHAAASPQVQKAERVNPTYDHDRVRSLYKDTQF